jgi:hypothetical protein
MPRQTHNAGMTISPSAQHFLETPRNDSDLTCMTNSFQEGTQHARHPPLASRRPHPRHHHPDPHIPPLTMVV